MRALLLFALSAAFVFGQSGQIRQPKGTWQKPGEIQKPTGPWQKPGPIQVPKGIQAIRAHDDKCEHRFIVGADALFEFDKATLSPEAKDTLSALGPMIQKAGKHPAIIEGHTDSVGTGSYNQELSERRARTVLGWLLEHRFLEERSSKTQGFGESRPAAPNAKPDGSDSPEGRQKNRRVEVVIDTCK